MNSENDKQNRVLMGVCPKPHGIKGGVQFIPLNEQSDLLTEGQTFFYKRKDAEAWEKGVLTIAEISAGPKWYLQFEEIKNRTDAERMTPFELYADRSMFPEIDEDQIYLADLLKMNVHLVDTKKQYGKVIDVYNNGFQEILVIQGQEGNIELPFVEDFFPEIDEEQQILYMVKPEWIEGD